jgi:CubicO group peptidase (beta-lactamase class C family)
MTFDAARAVITAGLASRAFPAAVVEVGKAGSVSWREAFGRLTYDADAPQATEHTIFDLASLTKVIATTSLAMRAVEAGHIEVSTPVSSLRPAWRGGDYARITIRHLLDHSSGLPARVRLWEQSHGRAAFEPRILATPLESAPGTRAVYSDLDFMLLGFILEDLGAGGLDAQFARLAAGFGGEIGFRPSSSLLARIAPTEHDSWRGRVLRGEVHDENAAALEGVAGHAGLFGTAASVGAFARLVLRTFAGQTVLGQPATMKLFARRTGVPESSRALGWDTMLPTSSCGTRMSASAIGHTGFTGTSLWIDPEQDRYVVLLTNRVHPTRTNEQLPKLRARIHDAIADGY